MCFVLWYFYSMELLIKTIEILSILNYNLQQNFYISVVFFYSHCRSTLRQFYRPFMNSCLYIGKQHSTEGKLLCVMSKIIQESQLQQRYYHQQFLNDESIMFFFIGKNTKLALCNIKSFNFILCNRIRMTYIVDFFIKQYSTSAVKLSSITHKINLLCSTHIDCKKQLSCA